MELDYHDAVDDPETAALAQPGDGADKVARIPYASLSGLTFEEFSERPDYPFSSAPAYGVFRNTSNNKWYGLVMNVTKDKVTKSDTDKNITVEILNVKAPAEKLPELTDCKTVFPCYHMHKGSWLSVLLDDTADDEFIMELIRESKRLTDKKYVKNQKKY